MASLDLEITEVCARYKIDNTETPDDMYIDVLELKDSQGESTFSAECNYSFWAKGLMEPYNFSHLGNSEKDSCERTINALSNQWNENLPPDQIAWVPRGNSKFVICGDHTTIPYEDFEKRVSAEVTVKEKETV